MSAKNDSNFTTQEASLGVIFVVRLLPLLLLLMFRCNDGGESGNKTNGLERHLMLLVARVAEFESSANFRCQRDGAGSSKAARASRGCGQKSGANDNGGGGGAFHRAICYLLSRSLVLCRLCGQSDSAHEPEASERATRSSPVNQNPYFAWRVEI